MSGFRLRIAVQKSGRLAQMSASLFQRCGLDFDHRSDRLLVCSQKFPVDMMLVRDDDIPEYVRKGICDLGVVGENVLNEHLEAAKTSVTKEKLEAVEGEESEVSVLLKLGFGGCRLSVAVPNDFDFAGPESLKGLKIATSYPHSLQSFLKQHGVEAKILELKGSVEIAPALEIADAVCDLVSSGATLKSNGLREACEVFRSQACLVQTGKPLEKGKLDLIARLLQRISGVLKAENSRYIMMNAPRTAVEDIRKLLPGMDEPSIVPLGTDGLRVAIHAVSSEDVFWETMEQLKSAGASSILVMPIEKVIV